MVDGRSPPTAFYCPPSTVYRLPAAFRMPRKPFLLRIDDQVLASIQHWAGDEMRSLNGQIEFLLRDALRRSSRLPRRDAAEDTAVHASEPEQE